MTEPLKLGLLLQVRSSAGLDATMPHAVGALNRRWAPWNETLPTRLPGRLTTAQPRDEATKTKDEALLSPRRVTVTLLGI